MNRVPGMRYDLHFPNKEGKFEYLYQRYMHDVDEEGEFTGTGICEYYRNGKLFGTADFKEVPDPRNEDRVTLAIQSDTYKEVSDG